MAADFREQLKALSRVIFPKPEPEQVDCVDPEEEAILIPARGAKQPPEFAGTIPEAFQRYCAECIGRDYEDPRGISVSIFEENFPKLLKLYLRAQGNQPERRVRAKVAIPQLKAGTFNEAIHRWHQSRLETLFWIEDVICDPDGIYPNCAAQVEGEEVYFKRYDKMGAAIKLVFTTIRQGGMRVVITSFLETPKRIEKYCGLPPLYVKK